MQSNFHLQPEFSAAGDMMPATIGIDEAYINGYFTGLTFQSILQPPLTYSPGDGGFDFQMPAPLAGIPSPVTYGFYNGDLQAKAEFGNPSSEISTSNLKVPKQEGSLNTTDFAFELLSLTSANDAVSTEPLINFFSPGLTMYNADEVPGCCFPPQLALLKSLEQQQEAAAAAAAAAMSPNYGNLQLTESSSSKQKYNSAASSSTQTNNRKRYVPYRSSEIARQRRQRISEKTRCLQKLLPWEKRMDMGTMLEEAYKYVKFLQAQISVLQSMPVHGAASHHSRLLSTQDVNFENGIVYGELGKLNRQQLLEVVVNSPVAQTVLYSRACCIYSMEQLLLLKKMAEKKGFMDKVFLSPF